MICSSEGSGSACEGAVDQHGGCAVVQRGELNELQRKSPEDLWKEDLAVFVEELEVRLLLAANQQLSPVKSPLNPT